MFKIVEFSHVLISNHLNNLNKDNIIVVDATCGNGNDSLFIANCLNNKGTLVCYDIQQIAINNTKLLLESNNYYNVIYKLTSFENISEIPDLVIYNCGYLPGSDKSIKTTSNQTLNSISKITNLINQNEHLLIIIVLYPGHSEGKIESELIDDWCFNLSSKEYLVCKYQNYNRPTSPYILTISKNIIKKQN